MVEGIGPIIAAAVAEFFANPANVGVLDRLVALGLNTAEPGVPPGGLRAVATTGQGGGGAAALGGLVTEGVGVVGDGAGRGGGGGAVRQGMCGSPRRSPGGRWW